MELSKLEKIKQILRPFLKKPSQRSDFDLSSISKQINNIKFFTSISEGKNYQTIINEVARCLTLEVFESGENIVNYGEVGDKFYIVLYGKVSVLIPSISSRPNSRSSSRAEIRDSILKRSEEQENRIKAQAKVDKQEIEYVRGLAGPGLMVNRKDSMKLDMNYMLRVGFVDAMKEVSELKAGDSFGELALISEKPRAATIEAKELVIVAVLSKADFKKALIQEAEKALKVKVSFLEKLPIFSGYTKGLVSKLSYYFQECKYKKGEVVYKEGTEANQIFFVNDGEFKLSQMVENQRRKMIDVMPGFVAGRDFLLRSNKSRTVVQNFQVQFAIKGKNEIIGHEELINGFGVYKHTCVCNSVTGVVFAIKHEDFKTRLDFTSSMRFFKLRGKRDAELHKSLENAERIVENFSRSGSRGGMSRNSSYSENEKSTKEILSNFHKKKFTFSTFRHKPTKSLNETAPCSLEKEKPSHKPPPKLQPVLHRKKSFSPTKKEITRLKRLPPPNFMKQTRAIHSSLASNRRDFYTINQYQ